MYCLHYFFQIVSTNRNPYKWVSIRASYHSHVKFSLTGSKIYLYFPPRNLLWLKLPFFYIIYSITKMSKNWGHSNTEERVFFNHWVEFFRKLHFESNLYHCNFTLLHSRSPVIPFTKYFRTKWSLRRIYKHNTCVVPRKRRKQKMDGLVRFYCKWLNKHLVLTSHAFFMCIIKSTFVSPHV